MATLRQTTQLGTQIQRHRKALGWSRRTLADRAGVSEPTIARVELYGHSPRLDTLASIADALDISIGELTTPEVAAS